MSFNREPSRKSDPILLTSISASNGITFAGHSFIGLNTAVEFGKNSSSTTRYLNSPICFEYRFIFRVKKIKPSIILGSGIKSINYNIPDISNQTFTYTLTGPLLYSGICVNFISSKKIQGTINIGFQKHQANHSSTLFFYSDLDDPKLVPDQMELRFKSFFLQAGLSF